MINKFLIKVIKFYKKYISIFLPPVCRFYPSCSEYAILVLERYSFVKGIILIFYRLLRCHPFCKGGIDFPY